MAQRIALIGAGNLGASLLQGWVNDPAVTNTSITATKRDTSSLAPFAAQGVVVAPSNVDAVNSADLIVVAVKPHNVEAVVRGFAGGLKPVQAVVSVVTGVSTAAIASWVPEGVEVYRAMPNTGAHVGESMTCLCGTGTHQAAVAALFDAIGQTVVIDETLMDAATVLGACGVAYVMRFIRGMIQGGIQIGFDADVAGRIVTQTVAGAAQLLAQEGRHPEAEIDKVTTPRGCTIVGLNEMEHNGFSSALIKGILASHKQIVEL